MSEKQAEGSYPGQRGRLELLWRWACFGVMPFGVAFVVALWVTAYAEARGQASTGIPGGPQIAPTLARLMNLSPLPERAAPGFILTDQHGRHVSLAGFRGRTVLLAFLDSRCTEVCPVIAQELIAADHELGQRANGVAFVAVNVNPRAASVADIQRFSLVHGLSRLPNWHFLTGSTR